MRTTNRKKHKVYFTLSARAKSADIPIMKFLEENYTNMPLGQIDSIFGFVEPCTLYGGRAFTGRQLSDEDITAMYAHGMGLRIPLTNHYASEEEYAKFSHLLEKYHRSGNSIIATNNQLAEWIRRDFPLYKLEASVIKNIDSYAKITKELDVFDTIVLPMHLNQDLDFLAGIKEKKRIRLFANAGCALTCPSKICYPSVSRMNKFTGANWMCSQPLKERERLGMIDFDLSELIALGFHRFKMLRAMPGGLTGF